MQKFQLYALNHLLQCDYCGHVPGKHKLLGNKPSAVPPASPKTIEPTSPTKEEKKEEISQGNKEADDGKIYTPPSVPKVYPKISEPGTKMLFLTKKSKS